MPLAEIDQVVAGWFDPAWVSDQFVDGNAAPFLIWTALAAMVGFSIGRFSSGHGRRAARKEMRRAVARIPMMSEPERAILLIALSTGEVWARDDMVGPASSLNASGYLSVTYSGGLRGTCYVLPTEIRESIRRDRAAMDSINSASGYVSRWGYVASRK